MADSEQFAIVSKGAEAWNSWRAANAKARVDLSQALLVAADLRGADLAEADLSGAHLAGAYLDRARLSGAILRGAKLFRAHLGGADLKGSDLEGADLGGAHLASADLTGANLRNSRLRGANFFGACLTGANLREASVGRTIFANLDLRGLEGLDQVHHLEPSTIGLDTYLLSNGEISRAFLAGAGIPEKFCAYLEDYLRQTGPGSR